MRNPPELPRAARLSRPKLSLWVAAGFFIVVSSHQLTAQAPYYLWTGQSGAQTQIDAQHSSSWYVTINSGTVSIGGGKFQIKRGSATTADITLRLYERNAAGTLLASVTVAPGSVTQSYSSIDFSFSSNLSLTPGSYYARLSSAAADTANQQYFIKGGPDVLISFDGVTPISTSTALASATPSASNLILSKSATSTVNIGGTITYTFGLGNDGGSPSGTSATVADKLPSGVTATAVSAGSGVSSVTCTNLNMASATLSCTVTLSAAINSGAPTTTAGFTITATGPSSGGSSVNYASVDPGGGASPATPGASCSTASCAQATTTVTEPSVTLTKTSSAATFVRGNTGSFTLTVTNSGSGTTNGTTVTVTDTLPAGLTPTAASGTGWTCSLSSQTVTCTRSDVLAASTSYPALSVTAAVAADAAASLTNTAAVVGGGDATSASGSVTISTAAPTDLTIAKTSSAATLVRGSTGTFTLTVTNNGGTATNGTTVTVTDTLPAGLTPTAASGTGWTCSLSGQTVTCTRSDVLAASTSYPALSVTTAVAADAAASLTNTAAVVGGGDATSASGSVTISTAAPTDLTIAKTSSAATLVRGSTGTFTLTVTNNGGTATNGTTVTVTDTLPAGLTPTAASGTGWTCSLSGQTVTCTRSDVLAASTSYPALSVTAAVAADAAASLTNTAAVVGGGDATSASGSVTISTAAAGAPSVTLSKTSSAATLVRGSTGTFTLTVTNSGSTATNGTTVTVTDTLPAGLTPTAASGTGWTCSLSSQTVTCTRSDVLTASASYPALSVTAAVAADAAASLTNTAAVEGGGDATSASSSVTISTTAAQFPDLTLQKRHSGDFSVGQDGASYSLVVTNIGLISTNATVTVRDLLPVGLTATAFSGHGWSCSLSTIECSRSDSLAPSASYPELTLTVTVAADAQPSVTNTALVSGGGQTNTANDSASDVTAINVNVPDLSIYLSHTGDFVRGQVNAQYTINVSNRGRGPTIGSVAVNITLPPELQLVAASGPGWSCNNESCERSDVLPAGESFPPISVRVIVNSTAPALLEATAEVRNGSDVSGGNNRATAATNIGEFVATDFAVTKEVDRPILRTGDAAVFTVQVRNDTSVVLDDVTLSDSVPRGFDFQDRTSFVTVLSKSTGQVAAPLPITRARRMTASPAGPEAFGLSGDEAALKLPRDAESAITAKVDGNLLIYSVGSLAPGETARIRYATLVSLDAPPGSQDTQVIASAQSPFGPRLVTEPKTLQVTVLPSSFTLGQLAIGRVFEDVDDDEEVDEGEPGLEGVRVMLATGESAITDKNGFYNLPAISNRSFVIAIDPSTLPPGYAARRKGRSDGLVRLQRTPLNAGALSRQNFPLVRVGLAPPAMQATLRPPAVPALSHLPAAVSQPATSAFAAVAPISEVRIRTAAATLPANGLARTVVTVSAFDASGQPASGLVRLQASAGRLLSAVPSDVWQGRTGASRQDATSDPCATSETGAETPSAFLSTTLQVTGGEASVCLVSDFHTGVARLSATALGTADAPSTGAVATGTVGFASVDRPAMLVAVGELSFGDEPGEDATVADAGMELRGQFFYQDSVPGNSQLTIAMNSLGGINAGRLFQLDPADRAYPVFGDSSTRQELAQSNAKVYARLDRNRSHIMFGDVRVDTALRAAPDCQRFRAP